MKILSLIILVFYLSISNCFAENFNGKGILCVLFKSQYPKAVLFQFSNDSWRPNFVLRSTAVSKLEQLEITNDYFTYVTPKKEPLKKTVVINDAEIILKSGSFESYILDRFEGSVKNFNGKIIGRRCKLYDDIDFAFMFLNDIKNEQIIRFKNKVKKYNEKLKKRKF